MFGCEIADGVFRMLEVGLPQRLLGVQEFWGSPARSAPWWQHRRTEGARRRWPVRRTRLGCRMDPRLRLGFVREATSGCISLIDASRSLPPSTYTLPPTLALKINDKNILP